MVPLIRFSEYGDAFSASEARSIGVTALVPKSAHISMLLEKVRLSCG